MAEKIEKNEEKKEKKEIKIPLSFGNAKNKENKKTAKKTGKENPIKKGLNYFIESKEELKKVAWPTRKEALNYTIMVIIISAIAAGFLGFFDYMLTEVLNILLMAMIYRIVCQTFYQGI